MAEYRFAPNTTDRVFDAGMVKEYLTAAGIAAEVSVFSPTDGRVEYVVESETDPMVALMAYRREDTADEKARKVLRNLFPKLQGGLILSPAENRAYLMALTVLCGV